MGPMQTAAGLSEDGDLWMRLGQVHMENENWKEAERALREAVNKGDLKNPGDALLLLGIARFNDGKPKGAERAFEQASKHRKVRGQARQWLRHVRNVSASGE